MTRGAPFLELAANRVFRDTDGDLSLDAGAFLRAPEYSSDTNATLVGKPTATYFAAGADSLGSTLSEVAMVGDDTEGDIAGELSAGLGMGILVRSSKYRPGDEGRATPTPPCVADNSEAAVEIILKRR
nr:HAD hydrolase-like protein [Mesobacterium pallidum]